MKKNNTTRKIEQSAYMGPSKSLQELIIGGRELGLDKALRARQPLEPFYTTADQRKNDILMKEKEKKALKDNDVLQERQNQYYFDNINRKACYESMIQNDKTKEETQQMNLIHERLKRVKSDNALFGKNIERLELEKHLSEVDQNERRRQEEKRKREQQWLDKMSSIEQSRP